jgi:deoxyribodipyrimidine photo-lyase
MTATIVWFRRDLRLADNPALLRAVQRRGGVVPVYLSDWESGSDWAPGTASRWWLTRSLGSLSDALERAGCPLSVLNGDPAQVLPALARRVNADLVTWNRVYEPYALQQDQHWTQALADAGLECDIFPGSLLFEPEEHLSRAGRVFVQFGAFWRSCLALPEPAAPAPGPSDLSGRAVTGEAPRAAAERRTEHSAGEGSRLAEVWQPGEAGAALRLQRFLRDGLAGYEHDRDIPGVEGVSRLSPHLHFGELSPHQVWHAVKEADPVHAGPFLRQLGWREFAHYLLVHLPATVHEPFRPEFAAFPWREDAAGLKAWQAGETGFPLVDAGMRQLAAEGWMHNRVRMVAASFLTKDLLIPWQKGAAWFWDTLVDADLANNTLGWQWTAGCGVDAAPYFRIYNPALQAERFDRAGDYIRRWSPPDAVSPQPIVDHSQARLRALAAFESLRSRAGGSGGKGA